MPAQPLPAASGRSYGCTAPRPLAARAASMEVHVHCTCTCVCSITPGHRGPPMPALECARHPALRCRYTQKDGGLLQLVIALGYMGYIARQCWGTGTGAAHRRLGLQTVGSRHSELHHSGVCVADSEGWQLWWAVFSGKGAPPQAAPGRPLAPTSRRRRGGQWIGSAGVHRACSRSEADGTQEAGPVTGGPRGAPTTAASRLQGAVCSASLHIRGSRACCMLDMAMH